MIWITRERPKIDRIACPWLIRRFIDPEAEFLFVPFNEVEARSKELKAIPYDIPNVTFSHSGDLCTFDSLIAGYNIKDAAIHTMAGIVRGADTDRHDIAVQSAGLWAISSGLAHNFKNDLELLEKGMLLYDALYSWAKYLQHERHMTQPFEKLLMNVFNEYLKPQVKKKKVPGWVQELKDTIQDQIDTNLSLKEISKQLEINPSYLSREFSKYFQQQTFGEYIRKLRIEKAIELIQSGNYSLTEIAYLTGFSDQSHFTRIFKKSTGQNPSVYRKKLAKK